MQKDTDVGGTDSVRAVTTGGLDSQRTIQLLTMLVAALTPQLVQGSPLQQQQEQQQQQGLAVVEAKADTLVRETLVTSFMMKAVLIWWIVGIACGSVLGCKVQRLLTRWTRGQVATKDAGTQSQTTYTWWRSRAEFKVLPEYAQGAF